MSSFCLPSSLHGDDNSERYSELSAKSEVAQEIALWELESYLEQYPDGTFALLARPRLDAAALAKRCSIPS